MEDLTVEAHTVKSSLPRNLGSKVFVFIAQDDNVWSEQINGIFINRD